MTKTSYRSKKFKNIRSGKKRQLHIYLSLFLSLAFPFSSSFLKKNKAFSGEASRWPCTPGASDKCRETNKGRERAHSRSALKTAV